MPVISRMLGKLRDERAFGIIEALIAMTIMSLVLIALLGLLTVSVRAVTSSKLSTSATQLANELIEEIRSRDYELVGIIGRDANGSIPAEESRTVGGITYTINYDVLWVDDLADGTGADDTDSDGSKDYKQVNVTIHWTINNTPQTLSVVTYVKSKQKKTDPPTVNFIFGNYGVLDANKMPPDGTVFGTDNSPYKAWFDSGIIPLKAVGTDPNGDLVTMRFFVGLKTPNGGFYDINPTNQFENLPICYWNPQTIDTDTGDYLWGEGTHEVTVEVWDAHGNRDAKSIYWVIDRYPPLAPTNLVLVPQDRDKFILNWDPSYDGLDKITRYKIYRKGPGLTGSFDLLTESTFTVTTFTDVGLAEWSTYQYYVVAVSPGGRTSPDSNIVTGITQFNLTSEIEGNKKSVELEWNRVPAGILVDRIDVVRNGTVRASLSGSAYEYTDSLPSGHATYQYQIKAYYQGNLVNQSIVTTVTT